MNRWVIALVALAMAVGLAAPAIAFADAPWYQHADWWVAGATVVLAAITAALAFYTYRLWKDAEQARNDAETARLAQASDTQAALSASQALAVAAAAQAKIAERQADIAERTLVGLERPYLFFTLKELRAIQLAGKDTEYFAIIGLKNLGKLPAILERLDTKSYSTKYVMHCTSLQRGEDPVRQGSVFVEPSTEETFEVTGSSIELLQLTLPKIGLFIVGSVFYAGPLAGGTHQTHFGFRIQPRLGANNALQGWTLDSLGPEYNGRT